MKIVVGSVLAELRRELAVRRRVYPGWVQAGKLTAATAEFRIAAIESAVALIEAQMPQQESLELWEEGYD